MTHLAHITRFGWPGIDPIPFEMPGDWSTSIEYEQAVTARRNGRRLIVLCSYAPMQCNDSRRAKSCTWVNHEPGYGTHHGQ